MFTNLLLHTRAVFQALLVTFLWSTSWVFIKFGIEEAIPPLVFAGLRYVLAFLCLLPFALRHVKINEMAQPLSRRDWLRLSALGLIFYAATQGAQFVGLQHLPAITVSLLLSFSAVAVALLGAALLREHPSQRQWMGVGLYLCGVLVYFYPLHIPAEQGFGLLVTVGGVLSNALASVIGRAVNRSLAIPPLLVTTISMGIGAGVLLGIGLVVEGLPPLSLTSVVIVVWLAVVNTAFAFTLWNRSLRTLSALESSVINNTMMIQIPVLAWLFLGEALTPKVGLGLLLAGAGILLVQFHARLPQIRLPGRAHTRPGEGAAEQG